jgi:hypothetical protein
VSWWERPNQAQRAQARPSREGQQPTAPHMGRMFPEGTGHGSAHGGPWGRGHGGHAWPWGSHGAALHLQIGAGVAAVIFSNPRLSLTLSLASPPSPALRSFAAAAIGPRSAGLCSAAAAILPVRAVTPAPGPRFLVPDCLNYSLSPPLCAFCFPLSAFAVLVCRSPFRSVGRRLPCCASSPEAVADCVVPCCCLLSSRGLRVVAGLVRDRAPCSLEAGVGVRLGRNLWRLNVHPWRNFRLLLVARVAVV